MTLFQSARTRYLAIAAAVSLCFAIGVNWFTKFQISKQLDNADIPYALLLGQAFQLEDDERISDAEAILLRAAERSPRRYEAYTELAKLYLIGGETNQALQALEHALARCGHSPTNLVPTKLQLYDRAAIERKIKELSGNDSN